PRDRAGDDRAGQGTPRVNCRQGRRGGIWLGPAGMASLCVDGCPPWPYPSRPARLPHAGTDRVRRGDMLRRAETLLDPTSRPPKVPPTEGLWPFYWHFIRQERWLAVALFIFGGLIAMLDVTIPAFIGRVVGLVSSHAPETLLHDAWPQLLGMACVLLMLRPLVFLGHVVLVNQIVNPGLSNMVRWQNHWHVVRQSWTFFQNDFAG